MTADARRFAFWLSVVVLLSVAVFFGFLLSAVATQGGRVVLDMTAYGERWVEYWLGVGLAAVGAFVLYKLDGMLTDYE